MAMVLSELPSALFYKVCYH